MTTLKAIHTRPYHLPLKSALAWGKGHQLEHLAHVLVIAELSDGTLGIAEATPRPTIYGETPESMQSILGGEISQRVIGKPVTSTADIAQIVHALCIVKNNHCAKGALDMALHMALAQSVGTSLPALLSPAPEPATEVSFILGTGDLDTVLQEASEIYAAGVRCLKVKIGKDLTSELALINTLRAAFPDMKLYADANECYALDTVLPVLDQLAEQGILYCEEPLPVRQLIARQQIRAHSPLPLIGDDSCFTVDDVQRELDFDTFDLVNIKTARTGFSHSQQIAARVTAANKTVMVGSQASGLLGALHALIYACALGAPHPTEGSFFLKVDAPAPDIIRDGVVTLADAYQTLIQLQTDLLGQSGF